MCLGPGRSIEPIIIIIILNVCLRFVRKWFECAPIVRRITAVPINIALVQCFGDQFGIKFESHSIGIALQTIKWLMNHISVSDVSRSI